MKNEYIGNPQEFPNNEQVYYLLDEVLAGFEATTYKNVNLKEILLETHGRPTIKNETRKISEVMKVSQYQHAIYRLITAYQLMNQSDEEPDQFYLTRKGMEAMKLGSVEKYINNLENPALTKNEKATLSIATFSLVFSFFPTIPQWIISLFSS